MQRRVEGTKGGRTGFEVEEKEGEGISDTGWKGDWNDRIRKEEVVETAMVKGKEDIYCVSV